jgi:hypothetical protein
LELQRERRNLILHGLAVFNGWPIVSNAPPGAVVGRADFYLLFRADACSMRGRAQYAKLATRLNLLDSASIGSAYSSWVFSSLEWLDLNMTRFRLICGTIRNVLLLMRFGLPFPSVSELQKMYRSRVSAPFCSGRDVTSRIGQPNLKGINRFESAFPRITFTQENFPLLQQIHCTIGNYPQRKLLPVI